MSILKTLYIMISLAVVFLVCSIVHKYLVSLIKRLLSIKAKVFAEEMKTFMRVNTAQYLIPYLEKKAEHLNLLERQHGVPFIRKRQVGLRPHYLLQAVLKQEPPCFPAGYSGLVFHEHVKNAYLGL